MTNRNDNRERKNKYPNNKKQDAEFSKDFSIHSKMIKKPADWRAPRGEETDA